MKDVIGFEQDGKPLRRLHDFHRIFHLPGAGVAPGQAVRRVVEAVGHIFPLRQAPLGIGKLAVALLDAAVRAGGAGVAVLGNVEYSRVVPDAIEIRLPIGEAWDVLGLAGSGLALGGEGRQG